MKWKSEAVLLEDGATILEALKATVLVSVTDVETFLKHVALKTDTASPDVRKNSGAEAVINNVTVWPVTVSLGVLFLVTQRKINEASLFKKGISRSGGGGGA